MVIWVAESKYLQGNLQELALLSAGLSGRAWVGGL